MGRHKIIQESTQITVYIEKATNENLEKISFKQQLSKNHIVRKAISEYIAKIGETN